VARVTVEDCLDKTFSRFSLVMLVAKRAKQIMKGSETTVKSKGNKEVVTSLREVAAGHVYFSPDVSAGDAMLQIQKDLNR
jgi:DNA-directed RNA polymerase subunit omega